MTTAALAWWAVLSAIGGVAALGVLYVLVVLATILGTCVAMAVAGLRAWWRNRRLPTR